MNGIDPAEAALMAAHGEVRADWERLEAYGATIPEVWRAAVFDGPDLVALLTEPEPHRAALLALVEHPDRLTVRATPYSLRRIQQVGEEVFEVVGRRSGRWTSAGPREASYAITLRSNEAELAAELHERFGDVLEVSLGPHRFPLDRSARAPQPGPVPTVDLPDLVLVAEPDAGPVAPGDVVHGRVRFRSTAAPGRIRLSAGSPAVGVLLHPDGTRAGTFTGAIAGLERGLDLGPGEQATAGFVAGTDAVDPVQGAALPAGDYALVVPVRLYELEGGTPVSGVVVTPFVTVTISG